MAKQAGLVDIQVDEKAYNFDVMSNCNDPLYKQVKKSLPQADNLGNYIVSINVTAKKKATM